MSGISKPTNPLVEAILDRAATFGSMQQEILVVPWSGSGGDQITEDFIPVLRSATPVAISLWSETALVTGGTYTLDLKLNGVTILSGVFDLTSLPAKTLTALTINGGVTFVRGDYLTTVATSDAVDLTGSGLRIIFEF